MRLRSSTLPRILVPVFPSSPLKCSRVQFSTFSATAVSGRLSSYGFSVTLSFSFNSLWRDSAGCAILTAQRIASIITCSGTSFAPASTMTTFWSFTATTRSRSEASRSSLVRKALNSPFTRPIRRPATGPSNGTPAFRRAEEAAIIATTSGRKLGSIERTVVTTWTSWR